MNDPDDFWSNRFHSCALVAGFIAVAEGRLADSEYVKRLCYDLYESGAFRITATGPVDPDESAEVGQLAPAARKVG